MTLSEGIIEPEFSRSCDFTILIPVRNGADYIEAALQSALGQTTERLHVIVSDNQSSDDTAQILERYRSDARVRIVRQAESLSMLAHFNACLDLVETKYYMLLCHDDLLASPDALERAVEVAEREADVSAVYCDLQYIDQAGRHLAYRRFDRAGEIDGDVIGRKAVLSMRNQFGIPLLVRTVSRSTHRYDTHLPYVADVEMSWFLANVGKTYHLPLAYIANRYHANNSTRGLMNNMLREMKLVAQSHAMPLNKLASVRMSLSSASMALAKTLFFKAIHLRDVMNRG
ncbi:Glycosyltransferase involved in cell wall bisynthesis [Devosia sp. YR412]|uniref:glycosyltransferase family 2 protein n=1 Tax=Devosia sp. YR412 TaxID=1881030 RepID=UPI0008C995C0|nr:glycosyltransferase family 2 protein [Devosia sp. YR412]SEQ32270.1 Glycosyltransferase involved in cell wall bisynthesis [Devosia sp. YR412]